MRAEHLYAQRKQALTAQFGTLRSVIAERIWLLVIATLLCCGATIYFLRR
jgi:hypothetical protein